MIIPRGGLNGRAMDVGGTEGHLRNFDKGVFAHTRNLTYQILVCSPKCLSPEIWNPN